MVTILTIIDSPSDTAFFNKVFHQVNIKVVSAEPSYASYLKTLQYDPDIVIMEVPANPRTHLQFLRIIRNNKAIDQKPFVLFGPSFDQPTLDALFGVGADAYFARPLNIKEIVEKIRDILLHIATRKDTSTEVNQLDQDELESLRDTSIPVLQRIELMKKHIGRLLAFPATIASILKVTQDQKSGARDLAQIIRSDPSVSTEILKVANSVYFSRGGKRICDIRDAVVRIGFSQTKSIAMSLSVFQIMNHENYQTGFSHKEFWFHNLGVAVIAERIAKTCTLVAPEEAFIGGLLHDLGILLLNEFFNDIFLDILDKTTNKGSRFIEVEKELLGFTHLEVISDLIEEWNFPDSLKQICLDKPYTAVFTDEYLKSNLLHSIIVISEIIANSLSLGREADCCVAPVPANILKQIRFPYGFHKSFYEGVYNDLNMFNSMLRIDGRKFPESQNVLSDAPNVRLFCLMNETNGFNPVLEYLKNQNYSVTCASDLNPLSERDDFHAVLFPDAGKSTNEQIQQAKAGKVTLFVPGKENQGKQEPKAQPVSARILVLDAHDELEVSEKDGVVITRYPIDLRNVDLAVACLINGLNQPTLNEYGNLKPAGAVTLKGAVVNKYALIAHADGTFRAKLEALISGRFAVEFDSTGEGPKALNLARTSPRELSLVIVDQSIPMLKCKDLIKGIKSLPNHKRAQFCVVVNEPDKKLLAPLIKLGVRLFITEQSTDSEIVERINRTGLKPLSEP